MATDPASKFDVENPLKPLCTAWNQKVKFARKDKKDKFDVYADEAMAFYTGDPEKVWNEYMLGRKTDGKKRDSEEPYVRFKFCIAKVAELVQIFGPTIYHRNPVRTVTPRKLVEIPQDVIIDPELMQQVQQMQQAAQQNPQLQQDLMFAAQFQQLSGMLSEQQNEYQQLVMSQTKSTSISRSRAKLMETYLNFTPSETDLKTAARRTTVEALVKGAGVLWTELYQPNPVSHSLVGSFYDSIDNLFLDPDADLLEDCKWAARKCVTPVWQLAAEHGIDEEYLRKRAKVMSVNGLAESTPPTVENDEWEQVKGKSNDLIVYHKIYSKMGFGDRLSGVDAKYGEMLRRFGDNIYLVVVDGVPFPLNLSNKALLASMSDEDAFDDAFNRVQWPVPFWIDNSWPFTLLYFHEIPNQVWPMSHIRPALPELKFLNWGYSFVADKCQQTGRSILAVKKSLDEEKRSDIENGPAFTCIDLGEMDGNVKDAVQLMNLAGNHKDVFDSLSVTNANCDKRTGLSETMYASPGGMRSATEAQVKQQAANVRPDDMANKMEDFMSAVARKEALAAAWLLEEEDLIPVLGPGGAKVWVRLFGEVEPREIAFEYDYHVEAGSARKPNKDTQIYQMQQAIQIMGAVLSPLVNAGVPGPWNALVKRWAEVNDIEDVEQFLVPPPPPPDPAQQQAAQQQQQLEQAKIQAELQSKQMDAQLKQIEAQVKQAEGQAKIELERQKLELERQKAMLEMQMSAMAAQQERQQDAAAFEQESRQQERKAQVDLATAAAMSRQKIEIQRQQADAKAAEAKSKEHSKA